MLKINQFNIDQSNMPGSKVKKEYTINGDPEAEYILQVVSSENKFYNFKSKTFTSSFTSENFLRNKLISNVESGFILFPAITGTITYTVILIAVAEGKNPTSFGDIGYGGNQVITRTLTQTGNVTITLHLDTASTASYGDPTTPANLEDPPAVDVTSSAPANYTGRIDLNTSYVVYNRKTAANGFGLRLTRQPLDTDWYYQETEVVLGNPAGDAVSSNIVTVADTTGLIIGMELIYHKGTTAPSSTTTITNINTTTNTITFSTSVAFENGETMTFRAFGSSAISDAIGGTIAFNTAPPKAKMETLTKTVRAGATSASIAVTDTYGIAGGGHVTVTGVGINNATTNNINSVTEDFDASGTDGVVVMDNSSTVTTGTALTFTGSSDQIRIFFATSVSAFPSANKTIYLNLDNFITPGAAS
tara:strand:+ start:251 stop:1504 length:1254 start_codon:yes stop_codon:yes gene_type:complete